MTSIRRQLLIALLGAMAAAMAIGALATYRSARNEANALFDYHLQQIAFSVGQQSFQAGIPGDENLDVVIRVWDRNGFALYLSRPYQSLPELTRLGFSTEATPDGEWRIFAIQQGSRTIAVAQPLAVRSRLAADAALRTLTPWLVLLPALGLIIWILVDRGLSPLTHLAASVAARRPESLAPLTADRVPEEARSLVAALNDLLSRLKTALDAQRAFIADAAHELRTPLTALQLQVQLLERAQGETERATALAELKGGLQRTSHTVTQLLTLARQEPGAAEPPREAVALVPLARQAVADQALLAEAKGLDLGLVEADEGAAVQGDPQGLAILLANLIANGVRYTPAGGRIDVGVLRLPDGRPCLEVRDTGPGIPAAERERVFDRFYRRSGETEAGSGLGLAIVKAIAERHGARVELRDGDGGGLCVRVCFEGGS